MWGNPKILVTHNKDNLMAWKQPARLSVNILKSMCWSSPCTITKNIFGRQMLEVGTSGYIINHAAATELVSAIRAVYRVELIKYAIQKKMIEL
jgi:hypothetical protein